MKPTPTENKLPFQAGGFATLAEALDYAAMGDTGFNFYSGSGQLQDVLTYLALKKKAQAIARRLLALGLERGCAGMSDTEQRTLSGAGIGTAAGGIVGAIAGDTGVGLAVGAITGGVAGYLYDHHKKAQQKAHDEAYEQGYKAGQKKQ